MLVPLASSGCPIQLVNFYNGIKIYHNRPHLINKKLLGAVNLFNYSVTFQSSSKLTELINYTSLTYETKKIVNQNFTKTSLNSLISDLLLPYDKNLILQDLTQEEFDKQSSGIFITVGLLLPRSGTGANTVQVVVFNYDENYVYFVAASCNDKFTLVAPPFGYKFMMQTGMLQLIVDVEDADSASGEWLADKLFPKMLKWCEDCDDDKVVIESLGLVDVEKYFDVYKRLKDKYGKKMVEVWPENTDPLKFVYEDVAIATYLICLWDDFVPADQEIVKKPSFVDLGCGNGLLVYILSEEGYPGLGIDVRKRKIWDLYPKTTHLEVKTITPSDSNIFPDVDWIIGNHSDELTPWIPVIAARSSPKTNFFLLPCCCYNFDGSKYRRINTGMSQYAEYMQHIERICNDCGFNTKIDKLRIPSTKRTCLVGCGTKTLSKDQIDSNINKMLRNDSKNSDLVQESDETLDNQWINNYQARETSEKVRNCTKLDRNFVVTIINKLVNTLLSVNPNSNIVLPKAFVTDCGKNNQWNAGTCLDIVELVKSLDKEELKQLKSECGGLQTLMRNHRYIFDVDKGRVKLRLPYLRSDTTKYMDKPCWFLVNHPNGCLHEDNICAYLHQQ